MFSVRIVYQQKSERIFYRKDFIMAQKQRITNKKERKRFAKYLLNELGVPKSIEGINLITKAIIKTEEPCVWYRRVYINTNTGEESIEYNTSCGIDKIKEYSSGEYCQYCGRRKVEE